MCSLAEAVTNIYSGFVINCNTLLRVSTLLDHLQGEFLQGKVLPEDDPEVSKHVGVCYN
jgi:hypothetical protein